MIKWFLVGIKSGEADGCTANVLIVLVVLGLLAIGMVLDYFNQFTDAWVILAVIGLTVLATLIYSVCNKGKGVILFAIAMFYISILAVSGVQSVVNRQAAPYTYDGEVYYSTVDGNSEGSIILYQNEQEGRIYTGGSYLVNLYDVTSVMVGTDEEYIFRFSHQGQHNKNKYYRSNVTIKNAMTNVEKTFYAYSSVNYGENPEMNDYDVLLPLDELSDFCGMTYSLEDKMIYFILS